MSERERFAAWFNSVRYRAKYAEDHPVTLAAWEAWQAAIQAQAAAEPTTDKERQIAHVAYSQGYADGKTFVAQPTAEAVREACAKVCEALQVNKSPDYYPGAQFDGACRTCAAAIRALDLTKLGWRDE